MKSYRSRSRLVLDLLSAIDAEGPAGVTRLLLVANLTHAKLQELLEAFERDGWADAADVAGRSAWRLTQRGIAVLSELRRIDAAMQDHGLGL